MPMPAGVKKQVEIADELIKKLGIDHKAAVDAAVAAGPGPQMVAPPPVATPETPPAAPAQPVAAAQPLVQETPPAPPAQPVAAPQPPAEDWEHKYRVLQGKYDSEVPRLSEQLRSANAKNADLQRRLDAATVPVTPATVRPPSQDELDDFGQPLVEFIDRRAKEIYEPVVTGLRSEVTALKAQLQGQSEADFAQARRKLVDALAQRVPNYDEVNKSPAFMTWLDQADAYSGEQRGVMLTRAYEANDTERVIRFFTGFLSEHAAISSIQQPEGSQLGTPKVNLAEHVAPGTSTIVPKVNGAQGEKRVWKQAEIAAFYAAVNRGDFKRDPETRQRTEADIIAAGREGRIRP